MTSHLSPEILAALADGELQTADLAAAQEHLAGCATCTRGALAHALLKAATTRAAQRYTIPPELLKRLSREAAKAEAPSSLPQRAARGASSGFRAMNWAAAALLLVSITLAGSWFLVERHTRQRMALVSEDALATEVFDQHVATLAAGPPQVLSSDNHTVKPWFQGKLPFAFNLPESLPAGMVLDGANFTYLHNQPAAQLLFSIGRHRVSVFVMEKTGNSLSDSLPAEHSGFHVVSFATSELEGIAVSDVNPTRLAELVGSLEHAQNKSAR